MSLLAAACLILVLFALIGIGLAFAAYAVYAAFLPLIGAAWAAAIIAFVFLIIAALICLVASAQIKARAGRSLLGQFILGGAARRTTNDAGTAAFAGVARDHPLIAVAAAIVTGLASAFLRRRR
jgi:hypothetical protein